jgi:hypothetical protein
VLLVKLTFLCAQFFDALELLQVVPDDLSGWAKRVRSTKQERVLAMREGREKWVFKDRNSTGSTNKEKLRTKNFMMVNKSARLTGKAKQGHREVHGKTGNQTRKKMVMKQDAGKRRRF